MSEQENLDISRVVGLIMENPQLIEQIANLAKQKDQEPPPETAEIEESVTETKVEEPANLSVPTYQEQNGHRNDRARLLGALKPYVSKERAKAIDSMISIADILEMMRSR